MKNIKCFFAFILFLTMTGLFACKLEKLDKTQEQEQEQEHVSQIINIEELELINQEQFSEATNNSYPDLEMLTSNGGSHMNYSNIDPLHIEIRCDEYINNSRALSYFRDRLERYNGFEGDGDVITEFEDDRGYIIFDLVTEERISEVTGISETRLCLDRNDMGYYCFCIPPCDCFTDIAGDLRAQEEAEGIIPRRIGCIYYYDNMYIETILDSSDEEEIEEFLDFLDELGLPYLLREE